MREILRLMGTNVKHFIHLHPATRLRHWNYYFVPGGATLFYSSLGRGLKTIYESTAITRDTIIVAAAVDPLKTSRVSSIFSSFFLSSLLFLSSLFYSFSNRNEAFLNGNKGSFEFDAATRDRTMLPPGLSSRRSR